MISISPQENKTKAVKAVRKEEPSVTDGKNLNLCNHYGNQYGSLQIGGVKKKNKYNPTWRYIYIYIHTYSYSKSTYHRDTNTFFASLLTIARKETEQA